MCVKKDEKGFLFGANSKYKLIRRCIYVYIGMYVYKKYINTRMCSIITSERVRIKMNCMEGESCLVFFAIIKLPYLQCGIKKPLYI